MPRHDSATNSPPAPRSGSLASATTAHLPSHAPATPAKKDYGPPASPRSSTQSATSNTASSTSTETRNASALHEGPAATDQGPSTGPPYYSPTRAPKRPPFGPLKTGRGPAPWRATCVGPFRAVPGAIPSRESREISHSNRPHFLSDHACFFQLSSRKFSGNFLYRNLNLI